MNTPTPTPRLVPDRPSDHVAVLRRIREDHAGVLHDHAPDFEKRALSEELAALDAAIALLAAAPPAALTGVLSAMRAASPQCAAFADRIEMAAAPPAEAPAERGDEVAVLHEIRSLFPRGGSRHRALTAAIAAMSPAGPFDGWIAALQAAQSIATPRVTGGREVEADALSRACAAFSRHQGRQAFARIAGNRTWEQFESAMRAALQAANGGEG